jgi:hypothetical protein
MRNLHIAFLLGDLVVDGRKYMWLIVPEQPTLSTQPAAWFKTGTHALMYALHFSTAFRVLAFWVFDVWHIVVYNFDV